jgi:para-aminobenzoate synthetase / 4-amino-4-deoxychorismate lyase
MDRVVLRDEPLWLEYTDPMESLEAARLDEVIPVLREAEAAAARGIHAVGFISYEAAPAFDPALSVRADGEFPLCAFGLFREPRRIELPRPGFLSERPSWIPSMDRAEYEAAFARVKAELAAGNCYQANLTFRLRAAMEADPWELFLRMAGQGGLLSAYIDSGRWVIASGSPELFLEVEGDRLTSRPMKGTIGRGLGSEDDRAKAEALRRSEKDRAENLMIVDMIRNDLGRVAEAGSVTVPELFSVERYPTLWQMTSTVSALSSSALSEIARAAFPCASITGAPKVSAMAIIAELETTPRRIYTGSIVRMAPGRKARFSVAIRSLLFDRKSRTAEYGVGGGIVWDSTADAEHEEAMLKSRALSYEPPTFSLIETMLWRPGEGWALLREHEMRMLESADYFGFPFSAADLREFLSSLCVGFDSPRRARILLSPEGRLSGECAPLQPFGEGRLLRATLAAKCVDPRERHLYHKTTTRPWYDEARTDLGAYDEILFRNSEGELTEFSYGNLLVEKGGELLTPPILCGLLPGTYRARLIAEGLARESALRLEDLASCTRVFFINSVRGQREIRIDY